MRTSRTHLGTGLFLAVLAAVVWYARSVLATSPVVPQTPYATVNTTATATVNTTATQLVYYRLSPHGGLRIPLHHRQSVLALMSHAVLANDTSATPPARIAYGLRLTLWAQSDAFSECPRWQTEPEPAPEPPQSRENSTRGRPGAAPAPLWQRELYTELPGSATVVPGDFPPPRRAWTDGPGLALAQLRSQLVRLPDAYPAQTVMCVQLVTPVGSTAVTTGMATGGTVTTSASAAATAATAATAAAAAGTTAPAARVAEVLLRVLAESNGAGTDRAISLGSDAWTDEIAPMPWLSWAISAADTGGMSPPVQHNALLNATGEPGRDYRRVNVYYGDPKASADRPQSAGFMLEPERAAAININGPGKLIFSTAPATESPPPTNSELRIALISADSTTPLTAVPSSAEDAAPAGLQDNLGTFRARQQHTVHVPRGLHTLVFTTDSDTPHRVRATFTSPAAGPIRVGSELMRVLRPDIQHLAVAVTGPDQLPVVAAVPVAGPDKGRLLRVDVRLLGTLGARQSAGASAVTVSFVDRRGRVIGDFTRDIESKPAPFERVHAAATLLPELGWQPPTAWHRPVSEPECLRFIAPAGTATVRISAAHPVALRLFALAAAATAWPWSGGAEDTAAVYWRYRDREHTLWTPIAPRNAAELGQAGQGAVLVAQTRLTRRPAPTSETADIVAVTPYGRTEGQRILEPLPFHWGTRPGAQWTDKHWTGVQSQTPTPIQTSKSAPVRLWYAGARPDQKTADQKTALVVQIDGKSPVRSVSLEAESGQIALPVLRPGRHTIEVRCAPAAGTGARAGRCDDNVRLYIDQPPAPGAAAPVFAIRTVYELHDRSLRVPVTRRGREPAVLHMVLYHPSPQALTGAAVHAEIGRGRIRRVEGVPIHHWTASELTLAVPAAPGWGRQQAHPIAADGAPVGYPRYVSIPIGDDVATGVPRIKLRNLTRTAIWARFFLTRGDRAAATSSLP